jgi:CarboxypepD_reg-like domain
MNNTMTKLKIQILGAWLVGILVLLMFGTKAQAQGQQKSVIFNGRVVGGKSAQTLSRTYIYIPRAGRGTLADESGYFSIPVFPGDSITFSYLGYHRQYHVVPRRLEDASYSAIILMKEDVQTLAEVKVYPYSTEEEFKKAFVAMKLPDELERENLERSTNRDYLLMMAAAAPMGSMGNYRNFMDQQLFGRESMANRNFIGTVPFFSPFALLNLYKSIKKGDLKKKEYREILNASPRENLSRQDFLEKKN